MKTSKRCPGCGLVKSLNAFTTDNHAKDGHYSCCRECFNVRRATWRAAHPEAMVAENKRRHAAKLEWARNATKPCARCGEQRGTASRYHGKFCPRCRRAVDRARVTARGHRIEAMWAAGRSLREIADALGWTTDHLGVEIYRLRAGGFNLPYRRAPRDPRFPEQVVA